MRHKTSPRQLEINRRKELALELRVQGLTLQEIADRISKEFNAPKYDRTRANEDITRLLGSRRIIFENRIGRLISIQLTQLESEAQQAFDQAKTTEDLLNAVALTIKIQDKARRIKLLDPSSKRFIENKVNAELAYITDRLGELLPPDQHRDLLGALATIQTELAQQQQASVKTHIKTSRPQAAIT
jgi:hypothetical protein